jgi:pantoate--beta-alanine ligase
MIVIKEIPEMREIRKSNRHLSWGFVPTMGALHDGHLSLVKKALEETDQSIVSIFVNPTQFNNPEDLKKYPIDIDNDLEKLTWIGVDYVFLPDRNTLYPDGSDGFRTRVMEQPLSNRLEGPCRPGHFDGVCTILTKLFNITEPQKAFFGQKDAQQLLIVRKMVADLDFDIEVVGCPTHREPDGLAMSSRNRLLTPKHRLQAPVIHQSLTMALERISEGERKSSVIVKLVSDNISKHSEGTIDYVSVNDYETLEEADMIESNTLISLAVFFDNVRLIDNLVITTV